MKRHYWPAANREDQVPALRRGGGPDGRRTGGEANSVAVGGGWRATPRIDLVATEEPMEIRLRSGTRTQPVTVTMRTPGADFELAAGLLFAEGIVTRRDQLNRIEYCVECEGSAAQQYNIVTAVTAPGTQAEFFIPGRTFGMTSACGLCGRERIDEIERRDSADSVRVRRFHEITRLPSGCGGAGDFRLHGRSARGGVVRCGWKLLRCGRMLGDTMRSIRRSGGRSERSAAARRDDSDDLGPGELRDRAESGGGGDSIVCAVSAPARWRSTWRDGSIR